MSFVDVDTLNVTERLPGWRGRYFHAVNRSPWRGRDHAEQRAALGPGADRWTSHHRRLPGEGRVRLPHAQRRRDPESAPDGLCLLYGDATP